MIVADEHYHALGLYESLGFVRAERVFGVCRPPQASDGCGRSIPRRGRYLGRDGRPRPARPGARAHDRLARLRRERRRAPRRLRRLRAARPARRHGARARDEGAAPPRRGDRDRGARRRARSASTRRARTTRPAAAAASRISPTRRRSRRSSAWVADSLQRLAGLADFAARADRPGGVAVPLPQQDGVLVHADATDGPTLGLHRAGRWDEVLEIEKCWLTSDARQRDPQPRCATGRARRSCRRTTRRRTRATCATSCVREGRNTGQALVQLVTRARRALRPRAPDRGADASSPR